MKPFVLLHGFTGSPRSWQRVARLLPRDAVMFRPALLGHDGPGPSSVGPGGFAAEIERLALLIRSAGLETAHLAGYSLGGRLALGLLLAHPELFSSATLIGAHPGLESPAERAERARSDARWRQLLEDDGIETFVDAWERQPLFASQQALPGDLLAEQRRERLAHDPRGLARALALLGLSQMPAYGSELARIRVPVELVTGALDARFTDLAAGMRRQLGDARASVVPGTGHNVVLERPAVVADALRRGMEAG
jgi:2-succinyl-6-hydroxy-2,4-cyclohexadiene-1-carboxylate synthase